MTSDSQKNSALQRIERIATGSSVAEAVLNIFKAILSTAPFTGGIASLITDYIPSARQRRIEEFAEQVATDLKRLEGQVDQDYVRSGDFGFMFEKCFSGAAENPQKEKLEAFRAILVNSAIRTDLAEDEKEYFLNLANGLSVLHIRILRFLAAPEQYLQAIGIAANRLQGGFSEMFRTAIPGIELAVIKSAFGDLHQGGLVNTDKSIFATITSAQGVQLLGGRVSDLGRRFIDFCSVTR